MTPMWQGQKQPHTNLFRQVDVMRAARAHFGAARGRLKILSFGCSTGEELVTLRLIFPDADIFGCEINPDLLEAARHSAGHIATGLESSDKILEHGPFDLIVCFSVLCLHPSKEIRRWFPVSRFDEVLALLDGALATGGLLGIANASYRFHDSPLAPRYDPIRSDVVASAGFVDVFAHDGRTFLERIPETGQNIVFRRGSAFAMREDEEFADCLFRKRQDGETAALRTLTVSPVPAHFQPEFEFERSNLSGLDAAQRHDAIEVVRRHVFGVCAETGERGYALKVRWNVLRHEHVRPPVWIRLGDHSVD